MRVTRAVLVSVAVGLGVGVLAGGSAARVLTRPLRRTADAARAMGTGRRDVRVPVEGPPEIAEVAVSLNALAEALAASEGRQRRFLLSVSHELRNPLTAVRGFAESVADGVVTGDDARAAGSVILAESGRLEHLVRDLLDLARLGADDFRLDLATVDAAALLDEAARVWSGRAQVDVERPGVPLPVRTDALRLRQVLDGLTDNAVRMTPAGRPVVVAARPPGPSDPAGTRVVLEVRDAGPGLSAQDRAVAFEPGALGARYRDERPVGVGIGLSLVHGLVSRLGGSITVGEAAEGGARFTVALPDAAPGDADGTGRH
nr:HAMP domain-containing sensor histidine kinase [Cellulomonas humilata]